MGSFNTSKTCCRGLTFLVLGAFLILLLSGCGEDDGPASGPTSEAVSRHIAEGKQWLRAGEGDRARLSFLSALGLDAGSEEAVCGTVIADGLHVLDVFGIIVDYIKVLLEFGGPVKSEADPDSWINPILDTMLNGLLLEHVEELVAHAERAQGSGACGFRLDGVPVFISFEQVAVLETEFDLSDMHAFESFSLLFGGLLRHALVLDLDFDIGLAFLITEIDFGSLDPLEAVAAVVRLLLQMVDDPGHPDFLTMDESGVEQYRLAGLQLGLGMDHFLRTFSAMEEETDLQDDDVMGYVDLNGNRAYDAGEPFRIPHFGVLDEEGMEWVEALSGLVTSLRDSYLDQTEHDSDPENPNPFQVATLNPVLELLGLPGFIPPNLALNLGNMYANPNPTGLKDALLGILRFLDLILPEPPPIP